MTNSKGSPESVFSASVFSAWSAAFEADPKLWSRFAGRYLWCVGGDSGKWLVDCGIRPRVKAFEGETVDFELHLAEQDFRLLVARELNPQNAFLERKFKVRGKTKHALRFNLLLEALLDIEQSKQ